MCEHILIRLQQLSIVVANQSIPNLRSSSLFATSVRHLIKPDEIKPKFIEIIKINKYLKVNWNRFHCSMKKSN